MSEDDDDGRQQEEIRYLVLVEFAHRHLDFLMAELQAVLHMNDTELVCFASRETEQEEHVQHISHDKQHPNDRGSGSVTCGNDIKGIMPGEMVGRRRRRRPDANVSAEGSKKECCCLEKLLHQESFDALVRERSKTDPLQRRSRRPFALLSFPLSSRWVPPHYYNHYHHPKIETNARTSRPPPPPRATTNFTSIGEVLLNRCVLVRSVIELWAMAPTVEECAQAVQTWTTSSDWGRIIYEHHLHHHTCRHCDSPTCPPNNTTPAVEAAVTTTTPTMAVMAPTNDGYVDETARSWKLSIQTLGCTFTREEQAVMRNHFNFLRFPGPVVLQDPDDEYILIREVELDHKGGPVFPRHDYQKQLIPHNSSRPPLCCYFGRVLEGSRFIKGRGHIEEYSLKNRVYLGPTSMDTELSFVMANLAQVKKGSIVMDPFVGTGSILISCALHGAYCVGTDIDIRVLRGRGTDENVFSNFRQYNLPRPELIRSDNALYHRHFRGAPLSHQQQQPPLALYDAIVCDPPYGIRAGARKTGARRSSETSVQPLTEEERKDHIPQTKPYPVSDVMADLLDMAAQTLVLRGRLVYIIPSFVDFDPEADLPRHPCLETVHICYQPLSLELGRRLVAMEKIVVYDCQRQEEYRSYVWKNGQASADKIVAIRSKIIASAKEKPGYNEKLAIRKEKRKQNKEMKKNTKIKTKLQEEEQQQQPQGT